MKALTIRQPWAWAIIHAGKDIENRSWRTHHRGALAVHAAKGLTRREYEEFAQFYNRLRKNRSRLPTLPPMEELPRGAIIGKVHLADCVEQSRSPWFFGDFGFVLERPKAIKARPWTGKLGFFDVPVK